MPHLSLSLLGPFRATLDEEPITGFESAKVRALLAYLAVEADRPHPRDVLAGLLWPERSNRDALSNLRYALYNLRNAIHDRQAEPPFLLISRRTLQFNRESDHTLDVAVFEGRVGELAPSLALSPSKGAAEGPALSMVEGPALSTAEGPALSGVEGPASRQARPGRSRRISVLRSAVSLYQGPFLEGFSLGGCPAFEEWALLKREHLNRKMVSALRRLAAYAEQVGDYDQARHDVRRQLALEPWDEQAHRRLMQLLALTGRRNAALAQYEACRRRLDEGLGVEPTPKTTALYERIRDGALSERPEVWRGREAPLPPASPSLGSPAPFVARKRELAKLNGFLETALSGQVRVVFVTGEAGSGKTALIREFGRRAMASRGDVVVAAGSCSAQSGIGDPYLPFREILRSLTGDVEAKRAGGAITREHALRLWAVLPDAVEALVDVGPDLVDRFVPGKTLAMWAEAFAPHQALGRSRLADLVERAATQPHSTGLQQADLFEQVTRVLQSLARRHPLILVLDDLQWADAGSISLLFHLGRRLANSRILVVGAYRPSEVIRDRGREHHPLAPVIHEFQREFGDNRVGLDRAEGRQFVDALLDIEPNRLDASFRETLYRHTDGNPLFTIELLRGMQERGDLVRDEAERWVEGPSLDWEDLPARVEAVIAERLGRLPEAWLATLTAASVEGERFTVEVVARVQGLDEGEITRRLSGALSKQHRLVMAQSLQRRDGRRLSRYRFRHYLFQKYLYNRLDEVERASLHEAVGDALETLHGEGASDIAVRLARHFEAAGMADKAVAYLFRAGRRAVQMSAHEEAIAHYTRALELLSPLPDSPERAQQELALQIALGVPLQAIKSYGAPERGRAYARARELCGQIGDAPELFQTLLLQWSFDMPRAEHRKAFNLAEQLFSLARQMKDPAQVAVAHMALGISSLYLGAFIPAQAHLERALAGYDPQRHHSLALPLGQDLKVTCLAYSSWVLWLLGQPDQALRRTEEAITIARELDHPYSLGFALGIAGCVIHLLCGKYDAALEEAQALLRLWDEHGFALYRAWGLCVKGRVLTERGAMEKGLANLRDGVAACRDVGITASHTQQLANFIEACRNAGEIEEGLDAAAAALALVEETDERHFEAELHLRKGELLLLTGSDGLAEGCLRHAIEIARRQRARSWELRAATLLCRLWQRQGRREEARRLLAACYGGFTQGRDTSDLRKAGALLERLASG